VGLTDDVCDKHLNSEYRDLARAMTAVLCRKRPSPVASGQPRTWACGIVYVFGRINFLDDKSFSPHMTTAELCAAFDVGESTVHAKARAIEKAIRVGPFDPQWTLLSLIEKNPLFWMAEVNGLLVDLQDMPREIQEIAFQDRLIPYSRRIAKSDHERKRRRRCSWSVTSSITFRSWRTFSIPIASSASRPASRP
jgi:uncharacterized protein DUF6398